MLDIYTVTFIGHRYIDRFSFVEDKVEELVRELIGSKSYVDIGCKCTIYVGVCCFIGNSFFDSLFCD